MALFDDASLVTTPNGYKAGTLYSIKPTSGAGDMTVVRATTATRVNSAGLIESVANNVPRLDYLNASCPSLLVEPQRTNLVLYSEQFDNAAWIKTNTSVTANNTTSPDGTTNADKLSATISTIVNPAEMLQATSQSGSTTYSYSVYAKKSTSNFIALRHTGVSGNPYAWFNLNTGTIGTVESGITAKIESVGNGWYRCIVTGTTAAVVGVNRVDMIVSDNDGNYICAINGSIFIWGAQLELGSYPTSYIPTTSAAVTRNADVISKTGISSLIGQTEGTVFIELDIKNTGDTRVPIIISSANPSTSTSEAYFYINGAGNLLFEFYIAGIAQCSISAGAIQVGVQKLAFVYKNNDFAFYRNGTQVGVDTSGTVGSGLDRLYLGCFTNGALQLNDRINSAVIFPTRLTNAELASLTTL
jgi:hypothetical protein